MRSSIFGVMSVALAACGVFGTAEPEPPGPAPTPEQEKQKADENSQAPGVGQALVGIFVSSSKGNDEGTGSMERPLKTLAKALALGKATATRVLACGEDYPESLTLVDGVSAFGNFDCKQSPWVVGTARARPLAHDARGHGEGSEAHDEAGELRGDGARSGRYAWD